MKNKCFHFFKLTLRLNDVHLNFDVRFLRVALRFAYGLGFGINIAEIPQRCLKRETIIILTATNT